MHKVIQYCILVAASTLVWLNLSAFYQTSTPLEQVQEQFHKDLELFEHEFIAMESVIKAAEAPSGIANLQAQFTKVRLQYKRIEYLLDYLSPQYVKDYINGAPVPRIARNEAGIHVLEPIGLQMMEQYIFNDSILSHKEALQTQYEAIKGSFAELQYLKNSRLTERHIYEAIRYGLIRLMSQGISGFDSPASGLALSESKVVLNAMVEAFSRVSKSHSKLSPNAKTIIERLQRSILYLNTHREFNNFNRLYFTREFIQPLYGDIGIFHKESGIETVKETSSLPIAINYDETYIFSDGFFNKGFYSPYLNVTKRKSEVIDLGKTLFFDPILSSNNQRACASCHKPARAFTDHYPKSLAYDHQGTVARNAPSLINAALTTRLFWDMRTHNLEGLTEHVILSDKELHSSYDTIAFRLRQSAEYTNLFAKAFPEFQGSITKETLSKALAAYVSSLSSFNAPFDKYMRGARPSLSSQVSKGYNLFMGKAGCGTCHFAPTFGGLAPPYFDDTEGEIIGVPSNKSADALDADLGRAQGKMRERTYIYAHAFKTPSLRNVELTAPYMHNGVFDSLEEVMDFYNKGGGQGIGLVVPNQTLPAKPLHLDKTEIAAIIMFMKSLTDTTGLTRIPKQLPAFSNPLLDNRKIGGVY